MSRAPLILAWLLALTLTACANTGATRQEVIDGVTITYLTESPSSAAKSDKPAKPPRKYKVKKGDSVFSIAEKYGLDYKELAANNNIGENFVITPGQELVLRGPNKPSKREAKQSANAGAAVAAGAAGAAAPTIQPQPAAAPKPELAQSKESISFLDSSPPPLARNGWVWPVADRPRHTPAENRQGIHISTALAAKVRAANNGRVVYVGEDLEQFGKLILISHDAGYLSVYAENSQILVKNDQLVRRGEDIAIAGNAYGRGRIYFELRQEGGTIDPLQVLPRP